MTHPRRKAGKRRIENETRGTGQRYYGKYSGIVLENVDIEGLYRLKVRVPTLPGTLAGVWARPCVPYFGNNVGFFAIPPKDARVWVEFEAGNPNLPIWTGGFWDETQFKQAIEDDPNYPDVKIWQTTYCQLVLRDQSPGDGEVLLKITDPAVAVPVEMRFNDEGVLIKTGISSMTMNPESGIVLQVGEDNSITMNPEGIQIKTPMINTEAVGKATTKAGAELSNTAGGEATYQSDAAVRVGAGADLSLTAEGIGTLKAGGDLAVGGDAIEVNAAGRLGMGAGGVVDIHAGGDMHAEAGGAIQINTSLDVEQAAATNVINGEVEVDGLLTEDGDPVMVVPV